MFIRIILIESICAVLMLAFSGVAQSPAETGADVSIALNVAGQTYAFNGKGECTYEPVAYIYGTRAQQWSVEGNNAQGSAKLTLWRLAAGSVDMFSFYAVTSGKVHVVNTVKTSGGGKVEGSGKATFTPAGSGGTFTIDATAAKGGTITGTMKCSAFSAVVVEGG
ncbi:MAG: hypothetical protein H6Q07_1767 [Acidobacteria bacterium]|jgi:hypothetical protein|nr:hypothetical protein [Acidobacteriota bacterium]